MFLLRVLLYQAIGPRRRTDEPDVDADEKDPAADVVDCFNRLPRAIREVMLGGALRRVRLIKPTEVDGHDGEVHHHEDQRADKPCRVDDSDQNHALFVHANEVVLDGPAIATEVVLGLARSGADHTLVAV